MRLMIYVTHAADCERAFLLNELAACRGMLATGLADALFGPIIRRPYHTNLPLGCRADVAAVHDTRRDLSPAFGQ
jgi:hypothetical protein